MDTLSSAKGRGHHAPYTGTEEQRYRAKCKDLKRKILEVEAENDELTVKLDRARKSITRMRLERALLFEKLEEKTPKIDGSDSESDPSSLGDERVGLLGRRRSSSAGTSYSTVSETSQTQSYGVAHVHHHHHHLHSNQPSSRSVPRIIMNHGKLTPTGSRASPAAPKKGRGSPSTRPPKDPNAPKRPTNPFLKFCEQEKDNVRREREHEEGFSLKTAMSEAWHNLPDKEKKIYSDQYQQENEIWKLDNAEYQAAKKERERKEGIASAYQHQQYVPKQRAPQSFYPQDRDSVEIEEEGEVEDEAMQEDEDDGVVDAATPIDDRSEYSAGGSAGRTGFTAVNSHRSQPIDMAMLKQED